MRQKRANCPVSLRMNPQGKASQRTRTYETFVLSVTLHLPSTGISLWKQLTISSPRFRPFELATETTSFSTARFLFASRRSPPASSFAIRKISEHSIYERIVRPDISIPRMNIRPPLTSPSICPIRVLSFEDRRRRSKAAHRHDI